MDKEKQAYEWFSSISPVKVDWLWYPYIPCGKISILQGDPGCGKSMMIIDIISRLTTGRTLPDGRKIEPINVIYQCSEDGLQDTIKPRLERAGANCDRVAYINEDVAALTLDDEMIRKTIIAVDARLLVIDPFQAYVGDSDLSSATGMRRVMRKLSLWASAFNCAVVLVGHLNKKSSQKELYRGLGSVDIVALARSVLQVELSEEEPHIRYLRQVKSSLTSTGSKLSFIINRDGCFEWITDNAMTKNNDYHILEEPLIDQTNGKIETAALALFQILSSGPVPSTSIIRMISEKDISERTIKQAKKTMGVISFRKKGQWYWSLPNQNVSRIKPSMTGQLAEDIFCVEDNEDEEEEL